MNKRRHGQGNDPGNTSRSTDTLLKAMIALAILILILGAAVLAIRLRPPDPKTIADRDLRLWQEAVKKNDEDPWNHNGLALALVRQGQLDKAQSEFERALELEPTNWFANYQLALLVKDEDAAKAARMLVVAGKNSPRTQKVEPYVALGQIRFGEGDFKGALDAFERAVADMRSVGAARLGLGRTYAALGNTKKALEQLQWVLLQSPGDKELKAEIGAIEDGSWRPNQINEGVWSGTATPSPNEGERT